MVTGLPAQRLVHCPHLHQRFTTVKNLTAMGNRARAAVYVAAVLVAIIRSAEAGDWTGWHHGGKGGGVPPPQPCTDKHVLLISVDGLHQQDLAQWVALKPSSTLAALSKEGVTYTGAYIDGLTDSFPGIMALTTGGNVAAHGVYYDDSYDRFLYPPGTPCKNGRPTGPRGTEVVYDESIDKNSTVLSGGGNADGAGSIDPAALPLDSHCKPVYPHSFVLVNTIFEVARQAGLHTAWADKHPAYDLLNGPSGTGVEELYTPEINSNYMDGDYTSKPSYTMVYDTLHVDAAVNWIKGMDRTGTQRTSVPNLFGFNMQTVSVTQKVPGVGGYDTQGNFLPSMVDAMQFVDDSLARLVATLKDQQLYQCTTIIVTAKHGQVPIDPAKLKLLPSSAVKDVLTAAGIKVAQVTKDSVALVWLADRRQLGKAVAALQANASALGIDTVIYGQELVKQGLAPALRGHRQPDIIAKVVEGVIYTKKPKGAEHGGLSPDEQHVALLVSGGVMANSQSSNGATVSTNVYTKQVAPTILQILGLEPSALIAVRKQNTQVLPGP